LNSFIIQNFEIFIIRKRLVCLNRKNNLAKIIWRDIQQQSTHCFWFVSQSELLLSFFIAHAMPDIKTRQGFPSDNVNNNVDVQQGNNSNDVENLDDVILKMTSLPRAKVFKKSSNFVLFSYLFIDFSVEHYWKHGKQIFLHKTKFENFRKIWIATTNIGLEFDSITFGT